jgi:signal transduction histidine kinase
MELKTTLQARSVSFFFQTEQPGSGRPPKLSCVATTSEHAPAEDSFIISACRSDDEVEMRHVPHPQASDPRPLASWMTVDRVAVPLRIRGAACGVLDLQWADDFPIWESPVTDELLAALPAFANHVGAVYQQRLLNSRREIAARSREKNSLAISAMGAMVFQYAHRLKGMLHSMALLKARADGGATLDDVRKGFDAIVETGKELVQKPLQVVQDLDKLRKERVSLAVLGQSLVAPPPPPDIKVLIELPRETEVYVNLELSREALRNLVDNALRALVAKNEPGALILSAADRDQTGFVCVYIRDTGVGMTSNEVQAAENGFVTTDRGVGVGVMLARVLIQAQGGDMKIESKKGVGTTVILSFPRPPQESAA